MGNFVRTFIQNGTTGVLSLLNFPGSCLFPISSCYFFYLPPNVVNESRPIQYRRRPPGHRLNINMLLKPGASGYIITAVTADFKKHWK